MSDAHSMGDGEANSAYELVMPFVVTASHGGPYADESYVAGYRCGQIDERLGLFREWSGPIEAEVLKQVDLIAMKHGCQMKACGPPLDGWVQVEINIAEQPQ